MRKSCYRSANPLANVKRLAWGALRMSGHILSYEDSQRMYYAYNLWLVLLNESIEQACELFLEQTHVSKEIYGVACQKLRNCGQNTTIQRMVRDDVGDVMSAFKAALLVLRHIPTYDPETDIRGYSLRSSESLIKRLYKQYEGKGNVTVWGPIKAFLTVVILTQNPDLFRLTNTLVQYLVRITLQDVDWILEDAIQKYVDFEETLHTQEYDPSVVSEVKSVITDWFSDFNTNLSDFVNSYGADHGYGATAEVRRSAGTAAKYHSMVMTPEAYYLAKAFNWRPIDHIWPGLTRQGYLNRMKWKKKTDKGVPLSGDLVGEVQLVPKGTDKKRTVSKEPTVNQFFQKIIGMAFDHHFECHPDMRIDLHDQEHNRKLALIGSRNGSYSTIDLSNASDSVTITLVRELFSERKEVLRLLQWARTSQVHLEDGRLVALEKFAPMGAGDCFPVECVVFSAIITAVLRRHGVYRYYRVYGDDLVVPREYYDEIIETLKVLHFEPNEDKSYGHGSLFTESCGIECFKGFDVSPVRLSRKWDPVAGLTRNNFDAQPEWKVKPSVLQHWQERYITALYLGYPALVTFVNDIKRAKEDWLDQCEKKRNIGVTQLNCYYKLANDALDRGYLNLNRALICLASSSFEAPVYSHNHVYGFYTSGPLPYSLGVNAVYDEDIQDYFVYADVLRVRTRPGEDDLRYSKVLEALSSNRRKQLLWPESRVDASVGSAVTRLVRERIPYRDLVSYDDELIIQTS